MSTNGWVGQINNTTYEWFFLSEGYKNLGVSSLLPVPVLVVKTDLVYDTESQTNVLFEVFGLGIWRSTKNFFISKPQYGYHYVEFIQMNSKTYMMPVFGQV